MFIEETGAGMDQPCCAGAERLTLMIASLIISERKDQ